MPFPKLWTNLHRKLLQTSIGLRHNSCPHCRADNEYVGTNEVLTTAFDELLQKTGSLFDVP